MIAKQRDNAAKFLYDMAKGIGLIAVVGGMVSGQATLTSAILGLFAMGALFLWAYWLDGQGE